MSTATKKASNEKVTVDDLAEQMAILRDDLSALTGTMSELMQTRAENLSDKAKERIETASASAKAQADAAHHAFDDAVTQNPGTALAIAAGAGFLVGMFSARK